MGVAIFLSLPFTRGSKTSLARLKNSPPSYLVISVKMNLLISINCGTNSGAHSSAIVINLCNVKVPSVSYSIPRLACGCPRSQISGFPALSSFRWMVRTSSSATTTSTCPRDTASASALPCPRAGLPPRRSRRSRYSHSLK